jgi:hypothetical protein
MLPRVAALPKENAMRTDTVPLHPFAMLLDPEATLAAIQRSERLSRIQGRICRPLDRPAPGAADPRATPGDGPSDFGALDEAH